MRFQLFCLLACLVPSAVARGELPKPAPEQKKPVFEDTNCGVACAFLSARYFGSKVSMTEVVESFPDDMRAPGALIPAQDVAGVIRKLGCEAVVHQMDKAKGLAAIEPGSVLHLSIVRDSRTPAREHFVVYLRNQGEKVTIADPDHWGEPFVVDREELLGYWTGYVIAVSEDRSLLRILWLVSGVLGVSLLGALVWRGRKSVRACQPAGVKTAVLVVPLVALLGVCGCGGNPQPRKPAENVEAPGLVDDLGVVPCDKIIVEATVTPHIPASAPVKIKEMVQTCSCAASEGNLIGTTFDPAAPRKILYRVALRSEGPFRGRVSIKFDNGMSYERDLRAFHEGLAHPSASSILVPFYDNKSSAKGTFTVQRLRHHGSPQLAPKTPVIDKGWVRVRLTATNGTDVPKQAAIGGDTAGVVDRLEWAWETAVEQSHPTNQSALLEWKDASIPPVTIVFVPELRGTLYCPVTVLVLKPGAEGSLEANIPLRSDTLDLAKASASVNGKKVAWLLEKTAPGCWAGKLKIDRHLLNGKSDRLVVSAKEASLEIPLRAIGLAAPSSK